MTPLFASRLSDSGLAFTQVVFHVPLAYAEVIQVMNHAFSSSAVGLAHDCQQVDSLPVAEWDVPLPAVMTPSKLWQWE